MSRKHTLVAAAVTAAVLQLGLSATSQAAGTWTQLAPMLDPPGADGGRTEGAAVSGVGDVMVIAGGYDRATGDSNLTRLYNILTDTWSLGRAAPIIAAEPAYGDTSHGGKVYIIGGRTFGSWTALQQYDVDSDTWAVKAPMPTGRSAAAAAVLGNAIYVIGGRSNTAPCSGFELSVVERYDIDTDSWSTVSPLPQPRSDFAAVAVGGNGGKVYVFGGCRSGANVADVDVYDRTTDTWSTAPADMPAARSSMMAGRKGSKIYVMGGRLGSSVTGLNEAYDIVKDKWTVGTPMPVSGCDPSAGRGETGVYSHGGEIYVPVGACPFAGTSTNVNWKFKP